MELVYLWVENYKNIQNQGFNFSSKYSCKYNEENLTIEKEEYTENIFDVNDYINITAIIGRNGSGKSSILECLNEIFRIEHNKNKNLIVDDEHTFNFLLLIEHDNTIYEINRIGNRDSNNYKGEISTLVDCYMYSINIQEGATDNKINLSHKSISKKIVHSYSHKQKFISSFMYLPTRMTFRKSDFNKIFEKLVSNEKFYPLYKNEPDSIYIQNMGNDIEDLLSFFEDLNDEYHKFLILNLLLNSKSEPDMILFQDKAKVLEQFTDILLEEDFNKYFLIGDELLIPQEISIISLSVEERNIYFDKYFNFFEFDFIDEKDRHYNDLSHGEKVLFGQLLNINYYINASQAKNLLFLFDEPETSLHPQWQKNYIKEVHTLFSEANKNIHFVFASHSPFLLSDIPNQDIIFIDKDKDDNCKVIDGLREKKQTFGANIHTLLSDSFFMDNGLMGEFAKDTIDKAIKYLNQVKLTDKEIKYCENIIAIIGEPIIKNQLQRMLDSKRLNKVDDMSQKIKDMEYELTVLKKAQTKIVKDEIMDRAKRNYFSENDDKK